LVGEELLFEGGLSFISDVLPLAAATPFRPKIGTRRFDAIGAALQHFQQAGPGPALSTFQHLDPYALARESEGHKDHPTAIAAKRLAAVSDPVQMELKLLTSVRT
jgi:hypothetical protein